VLPEAIDGAVEDFVLIEGFQAAHAPSMHDSGSIATK
jgi:molybdopterin-guanine dinucleotide biosynthesis protein